MDLIKTLLVYMTVLVSGVVEVSPAVVPTPTTVPTVAPYVTMAPLPTATPTAANYTTLYVGDRGESVRKLQQRLVDLGYLTDKVDGIYGTNTKKAVESFQFYNDLKMDGIAGKATLAQLYDNPNVVVSPTLRTYTPTPTPYVSTAVVVPVYYVDQATNLQLYRVDVTCYGSTTIYANSNYVSSDYTLVSSGSTYVSISNGVAMPSSVTFYYAKANVTVPIVYQTESGAVLYTTTATVSTNRTTAIAAVDSYVPSNYVRISTGTVAVSVTSSGIATPSQVTFTYRDTTPTATPVPTYATLTIHLLEKGTNAELMTYTQQVTRGRYNTLYASYTTLSPNYKLSGNNYISVYVDANGNPNTTPIFYYEKTSTPTPTPGPSKVLITVHLKDADTNVELTSYQQTVTCGVTNTIYCSLGVLPSTYVPTGNISQNLYVSASGIPAATVTFYFRNTAATATPTPTAAPTQTIVTVHLREQGSTQDLLSYAQSVNCGRTNTIYVNYSGLPSYYTPVGSTSMTIYVSAVGTPNREVVFYFKNNTPTATPLRTTLVTVKLVETGTQKVLWSYQETVQCGKTNTIVVNTTGVPAGYQLNGQTSFALYVDSNGVPAFEPTFYFINTATPAPTAAPRQALINVHLVDAATNKDLYVYQVQVNCGYTNTIYADWSMLASYYVPAGSTEVSVYVSTLGKAASEPKFYFTNTSTPTPTPAPSEAYVMVHLTDAATRKDLYTYMQKVTCGRYNTITVNTRMVPSHYVLMSDTTTTFYVNGNGTVTEEPMFLFMDTSTPTPTPAPSEAYITVHIFDMNSMRDIRTYQQRVFCGQNNTITVDMTGIPSRYSLVSSNITTVYVNKDGSVSSEPMFLFMDTATPTPTPAPREAYITVHLCDANTGIDLYTYQQKVTCGQNNTISANRSALPSYYLPASDMTLNIFVNSDGTVASEPRFLFMNTSTPTPTPAPKEAWITVHLKDATTLQELYAYQEKVTCGQNNTIYVNWSTLPSSYTPVGDTSTTIFVYDNGSVATEPSFLFLNTSTPVPVPADTQITVRLMDYNTSLVLNTYQETVLCGQDNQITIRADKIPAGYTLLTGSDATIHVFVQSNGTPEHQPEFYLISNTPTSVPVPATAQITVRFMEYSTSTLLSSYQETVICGQNNTITARTDKLPAGYQILNGGNTLTVFVQDNGKAQKDPIFYCEVISAPTAQPSTGNPTLYGSKVQYKGKEYTFKWYMDENGKPMISLNDLAKALNWSYKKNKDSVFAGHTVSNRYDRDGVYLFTVDSKDCLSYGRVWDKDLYVTLDFFSFLGLNASYSGTTLILK